MHLLSIKSFFLIIAFNFLLVSVQAQTEKIGYWTPIEETSIILPRQATKSIEATSYQTFELNFYDLQQALLKAANQKKSLITHLPIGHNQYEKFKIDYAPVMMPGIAAKYPNIKAFRGISLERKGVLVHLDISSENFHAAIHTPTQTLYIDPYSEAQTPYYLVYDVKEYHPTTYRKTSCGFDPLAIPELEELQLERQASTVQSRGGNEAVVMINYRFALACTGEYAQRHGGTIEKVLASFNTAVNRVNQILEQELAVRLQLVDETEKIIFLDPVTDPYINADVGNALLGQNAQAMAAQGVRLDEYDLGHVFTANCTDVGGVVGGLACSEGTGKGAGVTCHSSNNVEFIAVEIMAHEIAHQFTAEHSWSNCPGNMDQLAFGSAYEPGSGSTIMSYSGSCGEQNVQVGSDDYYHVGSLIEFSRYTREVIETCGEHLTIDNTKPELTLPYSDDFFIPVSTPFRLTANASDANGDNLTYCWEQFDLGPTTSLGEPRLNAPLFRSYPPNTNPTRVFPKMTTIVANFSDTKEVLPDYGRNMTFQCTVRDNNPIGGGVVWEKVRFKTDDATGPFVVTSPNAEENLTVEAGQYMEVTWDVANTDNARVNCQHVNIKLSTNGGYNYPITLLENTPNDGSEFVVIPDTETLDARVMVEAADNIFFDISNRNFRIVPPSQPNFALQLDSREQQVCLPNIATYTIKSTSLLEFDNTIYFSIIEGLPEQAVATFEKDSIKAGESTQLMLDFTEVKLDEVIEIELQAIANGADTSYRTLELDLVGNDYTELALLTPTSGTSNIEGITNFSWQGSAAANTYDIEVATSPAFGNFVTLSATDLTETSYTPTELLEENTLYYWRVRGVNECGTGSYSAPFAFHTSTVNCIEFEARDTPINISGTGRPTISSVVNVQESGTINDINIPTYIGEYQPVNSVRLTLISPIGTEVVLFDQNCGNTIDFNLGFDDEAPDALICPPTSGVVNRPINPLDTLNGENTKGTWTMQTEVVRSGFGGGGVLEQWGIEFCANLTPIAPTLLVNDTLYTPPNELSQITETVLETIDDNNAANELVYTIVSLPQFGVLYNDVTPLQIGDQFTQETIYGFRLAYENTTETTTDNFQFTVEDPEGGWFGIEQFNIAIDANATVNLQEIPASQLFQLHPNPASQQVQFQWLDSQLPNQADLLIFDVQGRLVKQYTSASLSLNTTLDISALQTGVYFVQLQTAKYMATAKLVVER